MTRNTKQILKDGQQYFFKKNIEITQKLKTAPKKGRSPKIKKIIIQLFEDMDITFSTNFFKLLGPNTDTNLTKVCSTKNIHIGPRLTNSPTN